MRLLGSFKGLRKKKDTTCHQDQPTVVFKQKNEKHIFSNLNKWTSWMNTIESKNLWPGITWAINGHSSGHGLRAESSFVASRSWIRCLCSKGLDGKLLDEKYVGYPIIVVVLMMLHDEQKIQNTTNKCDIVWMYKCKLKLLLLDSWTTDVEKTPNSHVCWDQIALLPMSTLDELTPTVDHLPVKNANLFHNSDMSNVDYFSITS